MRVFYPEGFHAYFGGTLNSCDLSPLQLLKFSICALQVCCRQLNRCIINLSCGTSSVRHDELSQGAAVDTTGMTPTPL